MSGLGSISPDDKRKFDAFMNDGLKVLQEVEDLKGGLRDTTKALAEEFGLPSAKLSGALRTVFKNSLADRKEEMDIIEEICHLTGHA